MKRKMNREEQMKKIWAKMVNLQKEYTWAKYVEVWDMCSDWNREHPEEEIFMCEHFDEDDHVDGICLEDDYILYRN